MNPQAGRNAGNPSQAFRNVRAWLGCAGFSMTEMIVVITVMGALTAIAIPAYVGLLSGSKDAIASEKLEMLNQGLNDYAHAFKEYSRTPSDGAFDDELTILLDLEYRNPDDNKALIGSPFVRPDYRPSGSSSTEDYRITWTGYRFKLIPPGQTGSGIKVEFDGSDIGTPYVYPPNFSSSGR